MTTAATIAQYTLIVLIRLLEIYSWIIVANSLLSWFLPPENTLRRFLSFLTEPVVGPFRKLTKRFMRSSVIPIDISPLLAFFSVYLVIQLLWQLMAWI